MATPTAVALDDATVAFRLAGARGYPPVEKARLLVAPPGVVAIAGAPACGKSPSLHVAGGLGGARSGRVGMFDCRLVGLNQEGGYLFQADALFPWKTAIDNVAIGLEITGTPRAQALERAQAWLTSVGLSAFANRYPHMLSCRQRNRVGLAHGVVSDPKILLTDEPFV